MRPCQTDYVHYAKLGSALVTLLAAAVYCIAGAGHGFAAHMLGRARTLGYMIRHVIIVAVIDSTK